MYVVYQQVKHLRVVVQTDERIAAAWFYADQLMLLNIPVEVGVITQAELARITPKRGRVLNIVA